MVGGSFRNSSGLVVNPLTLRLDPAGGEWSPHSAALEGSFQKNEEPFPKAGCWGCVLRCAARGTEPGGKQMERGRGVRVG